MPCQVVAFPYLPIFISLMICNSQKRLWSGEADRATTPSMSKHLEKLIPNCEGVYVEGKGHFLIFDVWEDMLEHMATIEQSGGKHESEEQDKKKKKQKKSKQHKTKETKNDKAD